MSDLVTGIICLWQGAVIDIPTGWALCDGNNGTPDLRDKFINGAGGALAPGATGGTTNHTHAFTSDGHFHTLTLLNYLNAGAYASIETDTKTDSGTTDPEDHIPPYYALAYIMRL